MLIKIDYYKTTSYNEHGTGQVICIIIIYIPMSYVMSVSYKILIPSPKFLYPGTLSLAILLTWSPLAEV